MKSAILVVSFGTTHLDTLAKNIGMVEEELRHTFPELRFYRAFTSKTVRSRLKQRYDLSVDSVEEALERIKADGAARVFVQPTLLIPGEEYDRLRSTILGNAGPLEIILGQPLLWDDTDLNAVIEILRQTYPVDRDTILLAMGHGTEHEAGCLYVRLAQTMREQDSSMFLCTVEGKPDFEETVRQLKEQKKRKVHLVPLLLVAGDHSKNDMVGDGTDSLRRQLEREGFEVSWALQGLGELPAIRERYVRRAKGVCEGLI